MKKYLITGGAGFIGSNLVKYLLQKYEDILIVNLDLLTYAGSLKSLAGVMDDGRHVFVRGDICDRKLVSSLFGKYRFDIAINLAAETHVDRSINDPDIFALTNIMGTLNMLNCAKSAWYDGGCWAEGKKYIQISTDEVYGSLGHDGLFTEETPLDPRNPYSASKASADMMVMAYRNTYNMPVNITRCSNNYGPYQFPEKLIPLMINNAKNGVALPVYGDGLNVRDWLYVKDHCDAIDQVASEGRPGEIYDIGTSVGRTNIYVVKAIIDALNKMGIDADETLISYVEDRKGHDRRYIIDYTKIKNELGWHPEHAFEESLYNTVKWYINNPDWTDGT